MSQTISSSTSPNSSFDSSFSQLLDAFRKEREGAPTELVDWQYVRHARNDMEQWQLHQWKGQQSFVDWIKVMGASRPVHTGLRLQQSLLEKSNICYERLFESLDQRCDTTHLNLANALDFHICSLLPNVRSILDYGAGYGRQAFLFSSIPGVNIFVNDAVETSYFSQYWVFKTLGFSLWEYFDHQSSLHEFLGKDVSKVIHLPVWQNDLIPDHSLDLVMFVWSFSEMSEDAAAYAINTCTKKLRKGGYVYFRDEPHSHGLRMEKQLILRGFLPVFQSWKLSDDEGTVGISRLYRYLPDYLNKQNTAYCGFLFTAWRKRTFSLMQMLVRIRRLMPF